MLSRIRSFGASCGRVSLLLLWIIGVPMPILLLIFLLRGCQ